MPQLIPVEVNPSNVLLHRAFELEQIQKRNMMIALAISIVLHGLIVGSYYLFPALPAETHSHEGYVPHTTGNHQIDMEIYTIPGSGGTALPQISGVIAGKIIPVPDIRADLHTTYADQNDLRKGLGFDKEGVGEGPGDIVGYEGNSDGDLPTLIPEAEPPDFVVVEHDPMLVKKVAPIYPEVLRRANVEGKVHVKIWVDREGRPHDVRILNSDNDLFNDAALDAARQFLFTPAYMNSGPVSVWVVIPFSFKLH